MINLQRASALSGAVAASLSLLLCASLSFANGNEKDSNESAVLTGSVPKASCGRGDHIESGLRGKPRQKKEPAAILNEPTTAT
jgi:hypothetical protein